MSNAASVLYSLLPVTHWARGSSSAIFWTFLDRIILVYAVSRAPVASTLLCCCHTASITSQLPCLSRLLFYALGFFVYATHIPERWAPGRFDNFCHSHQWVQHSRTRGTLPSLCGGISYLTLPRLVWRVVPPTPHTPHARLIAAVARVCFHCLCHILRWHGRVLNLATEGAL